MAPLIVQVQDTRTPDEPESQKSSTAPELPKAFKVPFMKKVFSAYANILSNPTAKVTRTNLTLERNKLSNKK